MSTTSRDTAGFSKPERRRAEFPLSSELSCSCTYGLEQWTRECSHISLGEFLYANISDERQATKLRLRNWSWFLSGVRYSPDNVQGPGCTIDPSEVTLPGCFCVSQSCFVQSCSCLQTHGQAYNNTSTLLHACRIDSGYCSPVFECNALCSCSDACSNRVVQRGLNVRLEVYNTENKGWGLRTLEAIQRGSFVCEYAGEVISFEEARRRHHAQKSMENNYIIAIREYAGAGAITETFVDPAVVGNVGRFLNHSCQPNLLMHPVRVHSVVPRLALFAGRNIDAQEELTFDYSGGDSNQPPVELCSTQAEAPMRNSQHDSYQRKECRCGANNCAKFLPLDLSVIN
ncbi:histone-lysine N-methyltransferase SETMAR [Antennarius striatus]|uniref:histone-lysine N-methyltransferase SETMAR n=1 Tax=Antennarius striatus TaxID=241820 RepID=UPI0035AF119C